MGPKALSHPENLIARSNIIVVLGPGGVGKTTSSVGLSILAAKMGKRVALLSIDPAKRLADAMGIKLGHELSKVDLGSEIPGKLDACMLDQAAVFDHMVQRFTSLSMQKKIFNNSIYRQASRNLGGPLEYMALAKVSEIIDANCYDLIVLDTPPDTHALDFLVKPSNLSGFVERGVMKWMIKPFHLAGRLGFGKLLNASEKLMGGVAAVTGVKMLERLSEFLVLMDDVINGFHKSGETVSKSLRRSSTSFMVVTGPTHSANRAGKKIADELFSQKFSFDLLLINKVLPAHVAEATLKSTFSPSEEAEKGLLKWSQASQEMINQMIAHCQNKWEKPVVVSLIPETEVPLHSLSGIETFVSLLQNPVYNN